MHRILKNLPNECENMLQLQIAVLSLLTIKDASDDRIVSYNHCIQQLCEEMLNDSRQSQTNKRSVSDSTSFRLLRIVYNFCYEKFRLCPPYDKIFGVLIEAVVEYMLPIMKVIFCIHCMR